MITKYAGVEIKVMLQHHTALIHKWCSSHNGLKVDKDTKDTLRDTCARMFELIEELPLEDEPKLDA